MLFRRTVLAEIERLDPERDAHRILTLSWYRDFPWDSRKALEFALFRTYAVPSISALLASTGEFFQRTQKRYDDTDLLISEFVENGLDSERGRRAVRRMNQIHGRFDISNDDYLYVLSTFTFEPGRWIGRFGWRPYSQHEHLATWHFWRRVGQMMGIRDLPSRREDFERFNVEYERAHFEYSDTNRRVGEATRNLFLGWFLPRQLWPLGAPAIHALMDEPLRRAFGFPAPPEALQRTVEGVLRARGRVLRHLPERKTPRLVTQLPHPTYPRGYEIEELGPPDPRRARPAAGSEGD